MQKHRKLIAVIVVALAVCFGFVQERIKIEMNFLLEHAIAIPGYDDMTPLDRQVHMDAYRRDHPFDYYFSHSPIDFFYRFTVSALGKLKWVLAIVFLVVNAAMVLVAFAKWVGHRRINRVIIWLYALFLFLALGVYALAHLLGFSEAGYGFARKILGALQSPIPLMIMIPAYMLYHQSTQHEQ
ncbi:MAG: hypothetical protein KDC12_08530 [Flavobacteriales bacterium]|nr:hypothetical protein [Flavobacteriales bacterium]